MGMADPYAINNMIQQRVQMPSILTELGRPTWLRGNVRVCTTAAPPSSFNPAWSPPEEVLRDNPRLPPVYPGGSPENPMGPRALTLSGGEGYAIHGTSRPHSIGTFASYGCIRMFNEDILDLFERVKVGTEVLVTL